MLLAWEGDKGLIVMQIHDLSKGAAPPASGFCATPRIPLPTFRRLWAAPASDLAPTGLPETPRGKALLEPGFKSRLLLHSPSHRPLGQG